MINSYLKPPHQRRGWIGATACLGTRGRALGAGKDPRQEDRLAPSHRCGSGSDGATITAKARLCRHLQHGRAAARRDAPQGHRSQLQWEQGDGTHRTPEVHLTQTGHRTPFLCEGQPRLTAKRGWETLSAQALLRSFQGRSVEGWGWFAAGFF